MVSHQLMDSCCMTPHDFLPVAAGLLFALTSYFLPLMVCQQLMDSC
jgi:hypothetical protein